VQCAELGREAGQVVVEHVQLLEVREHSELTRKGGELVTGDVEEFKVS
jgi:hypothetical protein